jgi:hypothetical protein
MVWTTEKPKQEGWYWYKCPSEYDSVISVSKVELATDSKLHARIRCADFIVENLNGQWSSDPIPEPDDK